MNTDSHAFNTLPMYEDMEEATIDTASTLPGEFMQTASSRETTYTNSTLNITHTEHWDKTPGDTMQGTLVSDFIGQMWNRLKFKNGSNFLEKGGPFYNYQVHTWHTSRLIEGNISTACGLTSTLNTRVNGGNGCIYDSGYTTNPQMLGGVYSHEFGHSYHCVCGMTYDGKSSFYTSTDVAKAFVDIFRRMRGVDFRPDNNELERLAEDFKYFFGSDGVANKLNPNDNANKGMGVRWAKDIPGLKEFIQGMWPIYQWLRDKQIKNFEYKEKDRSFKWERMIDYGSSRWECFVSGTFYRWDGFKWFAFNTKTNVKLPGNWEKWKGSGVNVVKGEHVKISASGSITFLIGGNYPFSPAGESTKIAGNGAPAPGLIANSLVVKTGGSPIYVGNGKTIIADATTELMIAANDDFFPDNGGSWSIDIEI